MDVQAQIDRITENIANTYSVLEGEGATAPTTRNSDNLPSTAASITAVQYGKAQTLTEAQKTQARTNIGAIGEADLQGVSVTKETVEAVLTGDITTHTHSQYVVQNQGTLTSQLVAKNNENYDTPQVRNIAIIEAGNSAPSGGYGDLYFVYV